MTNRQDFFEQFQNFLPKYLSPRNKEELFSELKKFPSNLAYYLSDRHLSEGMWQGDVWRGFEAIDFHTRNKKPVSGVILSNSCDIAPDNNRHLPVHVLFSPLIALETYTNCLLKDGSSPLQIDSHLEAIRKQQITSIFYLPEKPGVLKESLILLDNIHCHPLNDFLKKDCQRLCVLSQMGFYLFLMKLSIHFCRFQENIERFDEIR